MDMYVTIAVQLVAIVVWIARLEMKVRFLQETHDQCRAAKEIAEKSSVEKLNEIAKQLAELGTDVKWLICSQNGGSGGKRN